MYVIYCHQLPLHLICRGARHQIQPHFCLISTNNLEKIFCRPGGALAPPAPPPRLRLCHSICQGSQSRESNISCDIVADFDGRRTFVLYVLVATFRMDFSVLFFMNIVHKHERHQHVVTVTG